VNQYIPIYAYEYVYIKVQYRFINFRWWWCWTSIWFSRHYSCSMEIYWGKGNML